MVLRAPEELEAHLFVTYVSYRVHLSNLTVFKNIFYFSRNRIFSEPRGELNVSISGSAGRQRFGFMGDFPKYGFPQKIASTLNPDKKL